MMAPGSMQINPFPVIQYQVPSDSWPAVYISGLASALSFISNITPSTVAGIAAAMYGVCVGNAIVWGVFWLVVCVTVLVLQRCKQNFYFARFILKYFCRFKFCGLLRKVGAAYKFNISKAINPINAKVNLLHFQAKPLNNHSCVNV